MKETLASFKLAKRAKLLGFNSLPEYEGSFYDKEGNEIKFQQSARLIEEIYCCAPTLSLLQKWIRDTFRLHTNVAICYSEETPYVVTIKFLTTKEFIPKNIKTVYPKKWAFDDFDQALEIGLIKSLDLVEKKVSWFLKNLKSDC